MPTNKSRIAGQGRVSKAKENPAKSRVTILLEAIDKVISKEKPVDKKSKKK